MPRPARPKTAGQSCFRVHRMSGGSGSGSRICTEMVANHHPAKHHRFVSLILGRSQKWLLVPKLQTNALEMLSHQRSNPTLSLPYS